MKIYSGQLGIVARVDPLLEASSRIFGEVLVEKNLISWGGYVIPHISLYHSKLDGVPQNEVEEILNGLAAMDFVKSYKIAMSKLQFFGGKFLFWLISKDPKLVRLHEEALVLSKYFVSDGVQQADKEGISLSRGERENVKNYGHPFVGELWNPHITLGYSNEEIKGFPDQLLDYGIIDSFLFVRIGDYGTIKEILLNSPVQREVLS